MSQKRKAIDISKTTDSTVKSSPLASAYGIDDVAEQEPRSPDPDTATSLRKRLAAAASSTNAIYALDNATNALKLATSGLLQSNANRSISTVVDSRCIPCQWKGLQCHCQKPTCTACKGSGARCRYYDPEELIVNCLRCQEHSITCDHGRPSCSVCNMHRVRCAYPTKFPASCCESCRQPGRKCDLRKPKCSECRSRNQPCKYDQLVAPDPEVEVIDLGSDEEDQAEPEYEVEQIIKMRSRNSGIEYLVRWKGYKAEDDTWEPASNLAGADQIITDFHTRLVSNKLEATSSSNQEEPTPKPSISMKATRTEPFPATSSHLPAWQQKLILRAQVTALEARAAPNDNSQIAVHPSTLGRSPQPPRQFAVHPEDAKLSQNSENIQHILSHRKAADGKSYEYLVRWKGGSESNDSWVSWQFIRGAYTAMMDYKRILAERRTTGQQTNAERDNGEYLDAVNQLNPHEILSITNRRWAGQKVQYLVQWKLPDRSLSWEDAERLKDARHLIQKYQTNLPHLQNIVNGQSPSARVTQPVPNENVTSAIGNATNAAVPKSQLQGPSTSQSNVSTTTRTGPDSRTYKFQEPNSQPRKRGRPRKQQPILDPVEIVDNSEDEEESTTGISNSAIGPRLSSRYISWPRSQPYPGLDKLPIPKGTYNKHTVALHVLRAIGKHPWLPDLNIRLTGLLDKDSSGKMLNANEQNIKGQYFEQVMARRETELKQ